MLMRWLYVALFVFVFSATFLYFKQAKQGPPKPEKPVEAQVELYVPGMT